MAEIGSTSIPSIPGGRIRDALQSAWKFDEAGLNAFDFLGIEHLAPKRPITRVPSDRDQGSQLAADTYYFRRHTAALDLGDFDWYGCCRVQFAAVAADQYLVSHRPGSGSFGFDVRMQTALKHIVFNVPGGGSVTSSVTISAGPWYFVEWWFDHTANRLNVAVDGTVTTAAGAPTAPPANTSDIFYVGIFGGTSSPFTGIIDFLGWRSGSLPTTAQRARLLAGKYTQRTWPSPANFGYNLGSGLARWRAWMANPTTNDVTDVLFVGDSITQGFEATNIETGGFVPKLRAQFYSLYPTHGARGFFPATAYVDAVSYPTMKWVMAGTTGANTGGLGYWGYSRTATGTSASIKIQAQTGDRFEIHWLETTDSTPFTFKIGTDTPVTLGGGNPTPRLQRATVVASGGAGTYDLLCTPTTAGKIYIAGVCAHLGTTGLRIHECAKAGALNGEICGSDGLLAWMDFFTPKLVCLATVVNDLNAQTALATYQPNVQRFVDKAKGMGADVLLIASSPRNPPGGFTIAQTDYMAVLKTIADASNCAIAYLYDRWGTLTASANCLLTAGVGDVHPIDAGHQDHYLELLAEIGPAY